MKTLHHIPADHIDDDVWEQVRPFIDHAAAYAPAVVDWRGHLTSGEMGLLVAKYDDTITGVMVLQFVCVPGETVLRIILLAGIPQEDALEFLPAVKKLAAASGAAALELFGRKGFERWAAPLGFKMTHQVYRCEVEE